MDTLGEGDRPWLRPRWLKGVELTPLHFFHRTKTLLWGHSHGCPLFSPAHLSWFCSQVSDSWTSLGALFPSTTPSLTCRLQEMRKGQHPEGGAVHNMTTLTSPPLHIHTVEADWLSSHSLHCWLRPPLLGIGHHGLAISCGGDWLY